MSKFAKVFARITVLGLLLAWCAAPAAAASADKLLPADTDGVLHVNIKALVDSDLVKKHALEQIRNGIQNNAQIGAILSQLSFDPLKDISSVTVGAGLGGNIQQPDLLFIARGKYDVAKFTTVLAEVVKNMGDRVSVSKHGDVNVYEVKLPNDLSTYAAFLDNSVLVGSNSKALVESAIDQNKGKKEGAALKKETATAVEKADANQTVWIAGNIPGALKELAKSNPQGEVVDKIEALTLGISVKDGVSFEFAIHTTEDKVAEELRGQVEQGLQIATALILQNEQAAAASDFIGAIKVAASGKKVTLSASYSADMIEKAIKKAREGN